MVVLFIDVIIIRYKFAETFARVRLAPTWVFYLCAIVGAVAMAWAVVATFTNPWTSLLDKTTWIIWIGGIAVLSLIVGGLLFFVGQATARKSADTSDEEIIADVTGGTDVALSD